MGDVARAALYSVLPAAAIALGSGVPLLYRPRGPLRSAIQHFAAGVIFAVATVELLPDVVRDHAPYESALAFALGVALVLGLGWLAGRLGNARAGEDARTTPAALLVPVGIDLLIDGVLLGIGFAAAASVGRLLALALSLEGLSLGVVTALTLRQAGWPEGRASAAGAALGLIIPLGATAGAAVLSGLSGHSLSLTLAFGLAALLYLVTEELLVEAHEVPERPWITAMFFAGFVLFLVLGMLGG